MLLGEKAACKLNCILYSGTQSLSPLPLSSLPTYMSIFLLPLFLSYTHLPLLFYTVQKLLFFLSSPSSLSLSTHTELPLQPKLDRETYRDFHVRGLYASLAPNHSTTSSALHQGMQIYVHTCTFRSPQIRYTYNK